MLSTIWFIRHAESETNAGLPTIGPATVQLTSKGFKQAQLIAGIFPSSPCLIVTSSYIHSKQTARPTLQRFPHARHEEWPVHEFTYLSQSVMQQKTCLEERRPLVNDYWNRLDHNYVDGEGAESFIDFMKRAHNVLERIMCFKGSFIVIFSHGQFILAMLSFLIGSVPPSMMQFRHFLLANDIPNGAIIKVLLHNRRTEVKFSPLTTYHASMAEGNNLTTPQSSISFPAYSRKEFL